MKPTNLNKVRKAREKASAKAKAEQNAVRFGRTKAEKQIERAKKKIDIVRLEGHRRDAD